MNGTFWYENLHVSVTFIVIINYFICLAYETSFEHISWLIILYLHFINKFQYGIISIVLIIVSKSK